MQKTQARERLLQALPYFRYAAESAAKEGRVELGILAVKEDGGGRVCCQFAAEDFFKDLALVLGAPDQTEEDTLEAKATELMDRLGLRKTKCP